jgi:hypothetical protein
VFNFQLTLHITSTANWYNKKWFSALKTGNSTDHIREIKLRERENVLPALSAPQS